VIAVAAVFLGTLNVVGGWVVTDRMLGMFKDSGRPPRRPGADQPSAAQPGGTASPEGKG
jgi:NAD(P) transhydrogenase subunit alpha